MLKFDVFTEIFSKSSKLSSSPSINGKVIGEDVFECLSRGEESYRLTLTKSELFLQPTKQTDVLERFSLEGLFGVQTYRHKEHGSSGFPGAYLCFYFYPRVKRGMLTSNKFREKVQLVFKIQKPGLSFEDNLGIATSWKELCYELLKSKFSKWQLDRLNSQSHLSTQTETRNETNNKMNGKTSNRRTGFGFVPTVQKTTSWPHGDLQDNVDSGHDLSISLSSARLFLRRFVVILNPKSGQGKTMTLFKASVNLYSKSVTQKMFSHLSWTFSKRIYINSAFRKPCILFLLKPESKQC